MAGLLAEALAEADADAEPLAEAELSLAGTSTVRVRSTVTCSVGVVAAPMIMPITKPKASPTIAAIAILIISSLLSVGGRGSHEPRPDDPALLSGLQALAYLYALLVLALQYVREGFGQHRV